MKVVVTPNLEVAAEVDGAGAVVVGVGLVAGIGPGEPVVHKKYILNPPRRTRYRIGWLS